jgi:hypothetical protein
MESRDAVTYLLLDDGHDPERIAGYYCLSVGSVRKADSPAELGRHAPEPIPVVRMGRFAIDTDHQRSRWGADLLREALLSALSGAELIGARAMLVDAISEPSECQAGVAPPVLICSGPRGGPRIRALCGS